MGSFDSVDTPYILLVVVDIVFVSFFCVPNQSQAIVKLSENF